MQVRKRKIEDYRHDPANPNKGSARGQTLIEQSLRETGAGRSLVVDADDTLIGGNKTLEAALASGIEDVIEIETEGDALIVHKRRDMRLDDPEDRRARLLSYYDNRAAEVSMTWDAEQLLADAGRLDLSVLFRDDELEALLKQADAEQLVNDSVSAEVDGQRLGGERKKQIKPVLYVDEITIFEAALAATGILNRGQALIAVCRAYLEKKEAT